MTKKFLLHVFAGFLAVFFTAGLQAQNALTEEEKTDGFVLLFDGESTDGWRGFQKDHAPTKWVVEDGTLHFNPRAKGDGGDIMIDRKFSDFHLKLEWKIEEAGNSGILYLGSEDPKYNAIYMTAPEMQVLDNAAHPDAKMGTNGNRQAGSLYDLIPADPQNFAGAGEWNTAELIVKDKHVKHIQNGEVVVEYEYGTQMWDALVSRSKFPGLNPDWTNLQEEGFIGLQDHGNNVWFRNIKIKEL
ncbi:MAG: DUF1080 domain-containing protein [Bacteroidales bacterium]|nr:DUF1080 domain-containing protein [Bacteroidales bacterium]